MRKVNYKVETADGAIFSTTDYEVAKSGGNKILETYLTEVNTRSEKAEKEFEKHRNRIAEIFAKKRG